MGKRILVCDDDWHFVQLTQSILEREGHEVIAAFSAEEGLSKIRPEIPVRVVLDLVILGLDGLEILDIVRSDQVTENIPIIVVTANPTDQDIFEAYQRGADMVLTKPVNPSEILPMLGSV